MTNVVYLSGGAASYVAARRIVDQHGPDAVELVFADTLTEDEDLYRFLDDCVADLGAPITRLCDGRDVWQLFEDEGIIGNTRIDVCSRKLKRDLMRKHRDALDPEQTTLVLGIDWTEEHRLRRLQARPENQGWRYIAPLCEPPLLTPGKVKAEVTARGLRLPRLYDMGFAHNNCGGFCVKSGHAQFERLLTFLPERFAYHEGKEAAFRERTGKDVSILRDRIGGDTKPLTLRAFRDRIATDQMDFDHHDWGGCGCAL